MSKDAPDAFVYNAELTRIIDGDTLKCHLDLGMSCWLHNQTVRLAGIDTPESRINIKSYPHRADEKAMGLKAKDRLKELCTGRFRIRSLGKGKYGRILGIPYSQDGEDICAMLISEGLASEYWGGKKNAKIQPDGTWG